MAPKKKASKKNDDWESELGESAAPATEVQDAKVADAELAAPVVEEEEAPATGLMALMKKRKNKNKAVDADEDLSEKAPVEASLDDEFALPDKKGKGKAGGAKADGDDDEETGADGKVMTKAQKEKAKKEREKQRKKEQVGALSPTNPHQKSCPKETNHVIIGCQEEACHQGRNCKTCRGQEGGASPRSRPSRWCWWQEAPKGTPTAPGTARCTQEARRRACTSGC